MQTDTWVIAATNQNLEQKIERGKFRRDLYYRLNTVKITIEPLHKRPEGIPHLVKYYTKIYASESTGKNLKPLCQNIVDRLTAYHWPGNVRELQNVLRRFMVLGVN